MVQQHDFEWCRLTGNLREVETYPRLERAIDAVLFAIVGLSSAWPFVMLAIFLFQ